MSVVFTYLSSRPSRRWYFPVSETIQIPHSANSNIFPNLWSWLACPSAGWELEQWLEHHSVRSVQKEGKCLWFSCMPITIILALKKPTKCEWFKRELTLPVLHQGGLTSLCWVNQPSSLESTPQTFQCCAQAWLSRRNDWGWRRSTWAAVPAPRLLHPLPQQRKWQARSVDVDRAPEDTPADGALWEQDGPEEHPSGRSGVFPPHHSENKRAQGRRSLLFCLIPGIFIFNWELMEKTSWFKHF